MNDEEYLDINECFADDSKKFWENLSYWNDYNTYYGLYSSSGLPDPDGNSNMLYKFHKRLWNNQRENMKSKLPKKENSDELKLPKIKKDDNTCELHGINDENFRLGSDSIISIYFHWWDMQPLLPEIAKYKENKENLLEREIEKLFDIGIKSDSYDKWDSIKKFFWCYLHKANTIGGFIVFPKFRGSINTRRANPKGTIKDRFDLTLECIRRYYVVPKEYNPLFTNIYDADKEFFEMFGSFKNYIDFFCLQDWVNGKYEVLDLLGKLEKKEKLDADKTWKDNKIIPYDFDEDEQVQRWWNLYSNLMYRLNKRNKRIEEILNSKK